MAVVSTGELVADPLVVDLVVLVVVEPSLVEVAKVVADPLVVVELDLVEVAKVIADPLVVGLIVLMVVELEVVTETSQTRDAVWASANPTGSLRPLTSFTREHEVAVSPAHNLHVVSPSAR